MEARDRMTVEELLRLLDAGEGESVEFKSALPNGDDVASTMAAFANTRGGTLLVGVSDDRRPVGVEAPDVVMQRLASLTRDACRPALNCEIGNSGIGALAVVWVRVPARPQVPTRVRGLRYVRVGPTTRVDDIGLTKEALTAPIPPRLEKFRGREPELSHLRQNVLHGSVPIIVVGGISGIGKTALAARLASLIEADGYRVFWRECHPETTLDVVTLELGRVARASGDLGLADVLEEAEESELLDDRLVRIVSALARCRYGVFLDDYHRVVDTRLDRLLVALANRGGLTKAILCVSRRPQMAGARQPATHLLSGSRHRLSARQRAPRLTWRARGLHDLPQRPLRSAPAAPIGRWRTRALPIARHRAHRAPIRHHRSVALAQDAGDGRIDFPVRREGALHQRVQVPPEELSMHLGSYRARSRYQSDRGSRSPETEGL